MDRLSDLTREMRNQSVRFTAGRFLQAMARGKGDSINALTFAESQSQWLDRGQIVTAVKAAVTGFETGDFPGAFTPVADAFLAAMRGYSVPLRLEGLRRVPMLTRLFLNTGGVTAAQVAEGAAIPVLMGAWDTATLTPKKFAGIVVQTDELMRSTSPVATLAIVDDLAQATAEAENRAFVSPNEAGSVLNGAPSFGGSGSSVAQVDADLLRLCDLVPGAHRPGAAFVMTQATATRLATLRDSGGANAYPNVSPQGGSLLGLPVLVTSAVEEIGSPPTRIIGLLSPSEIFWADEGRVILTTSNQAALKMDDAATAAAGNLVSMWQGNSTATKAVRESSWHARSGSGAYFVAGF